MAQTDLQTASGQWSSTDLSAANTALTITIAAGGAGTKARIHKVLVSSSVSAAAADSNVVIQPDGATSPIKHFLSAAQGPLADLQFVQPVICADNTAAKVIASAFGGTSKSQVTVIYDYRDISSK